MSAAFQLDFTGPQTPCDFPGCVLDAYHDGDHQRPAPKPQFPLPSQYNHVCLVCHSRFVVMGEKPGMDFRTCGSQECLLALAKHEAKQLPVTCTCAQRPYPHELSVHSKIGVERPGVYLDYYDNAIRFGPEGMRWPWSLRYAPNMD
jgi:hypothetical protein